jgi:two-component system, sensor histidine kinase ChiS
LHEVNEGQLLVEVSDTGCGIRPEAIERIFDHLYQVTDVAIESCFAGRRGLGLGLQIARDLMTRLGGEIWAASELGKGSQFFLTLPVLSNELEKISDTNAGSLERAGHG